MKKFENVKSIQTLLDTLSLNHEHNTQFINHIHDLVDQEVASVPMVPVAVEDTPPLVTALPAKTPVPLFGGHNFCVGDHVEILNPNKKLHQANKGVITGKTNGGDSGSFLYIQAGAVQIVRKPWKLKTPSC